MVAALAAGGCEAAIDESGMFGSITVERGEVVSLPPGAQVFYPGSTHGVLVHKAYEPVRPSDAGFGSVDWGSRPVSLRGLISDVDWAVEGRPLPNQLPGSDNAINGWLVTPATEADLRSPITLLYQPLITDEPEPLVEIIVYAP